MGHLQVSTGRICMVKRFSVVRREAMDVIDRMIQRQQGLLGDKKFASLGTLAVSIISDCSVPTRSL
jgi:hypothetical protein